MKIKLNRKKLASALADAMPFVPANTSMAILHNFKFVTKGDKLKVEANNAQDAISIYLDTVECDADTMFCVDANDISKYIAATKGDNIELTVSEYYISVKHSKGYAEFPMVPATEFPSFEMPTDESTQITMPAAVLSEAISNAAIFASKETIRPVMQTIFATVKDGEFTYAASDTHKLIYGHSPIANVAGIDINWYIVPTAFKSLLKVCKTATDIRLTISPNKVSYRIGDTVINTVQTQGIYPNVLRVIPTQSTLDINVNREEIADTLKRISMFCDQSRCAKLKISPMDMMVSADNIIEAKKSTETIIHGGCASDFTIGMNADYILESLSVMNPGEINLAFTEPTRPAVMTQATKQNVTIILMPMHIPSE